MRLNKNLEKNIKILKENFRDVEDIKFRNLTTIPINKKRYKITLIYIESLIDDKKINDNIIAPLCNHENIIENKDKNKNHHKIMKNEIINIEDIKKLSDFERIEEEILSGNTVLLIENTSFAYILTTQGWSERAVENPTVERSVRGPQEAFNENININLGLIRRRIKSSKLKVISFTKGLYTKTKITMIYLDGIANSDIVKEAKKRINNIETAQIIGCRQIGELIEDDPLTIFDTIYETERPDVISAGILEGRIAILTDGCPTAQLIPKLFMENFVSPADYYFRFWITIPLRLLRFISYIISALLPGLYISIVSYHHELIPITLARTIYSSRSGVPFPIFIELLLFLLIFEVIKEAGAAVPSALSTSITIVGALILGQAAIAAGFLSADGVIIGSVTGITIFLLPVIEFSHVLFFIRIFFLLSGAISGIYGMTIVSVIILAHLVSLRSFGIPYLSPIAPLQVQDLKDFFLRVPYIFMKTRPESIENENKIRQDNRPYRRFFFKYKLNESHKKEKDKK